MPLDPVENPSRFPRQGSSPAWAETLPEGFRGVAIEPGRTDSVRGALMHAPPLPSSSFLLNTLAKT